jgi:hypothetical protein
MAKSSKPVPSLRRWIGGMLFASTVINYIDRQTLSLLAPSLLAFLFAIVTFTYAWLYDHGECVAVRSFP